jgi:diguanylate cyclase
MAGQPRATAPGGVPPGAPGPPAAGRRRFVTTLGVVYALALACLILSCVRGLSGPRPDWWAFPAVVAIIFAGEQSLTVRRVSGEREILNTGEAAFVVALAIVPTLLLVPAATLAGLMYFARRRAKLVKIFFGASSTTIGVTLGVLAAHAVGGAGELPGRDGYLAAACGAAVGSVWSWFPVTAVVSATTGSPWRSLLTSEVGPHRIMTLVVNTTLGVGILALAHNSPITLLVLPPVVVGVYKAYRADVLGVEQRDDWRQLNAAAEEIADLDEEAVVARVRARARSLFGADEVELRLDPVPLAAPVPPPAPDRPPPTRGRALLARLRAHPAGHWIRATSAPLIAGNTPVGELTLTFASPVTWTEHEDQVLAAFTHTLSSAIVRARLFAHTRRQALDKAHEATHDALTGLGNRRLLGEAATELFAAADAAGRAVGLILIDLDKFKDINDTLGHSAGDRLLRGVAERLRISVRGEDVVTRLGGDEFAILVTGIDDAAQAESVAAELADVLARPVEVDGVTLAVEGSVGIAVYPTDGSNTEELLSRADVAMYQAKGSHPRWRRYRADLDYSTLDRLALVAELRPAISNGDLVLHYQPQISLRTGRITGVEALARWQHTTRGLLTPETFVRAVEQSGFVQEFTRAILRQALEACAGWRAAGFDLGVSVNLSARNLLNTDLPGEVAQLLLTYRVPAPALTLEITETAMMADPDTAEQLLVHLSEIGVRIAVDDFGTGFSSLTLLQRCVLHEVKIDRSFVRRLLVEQSDAAIVAATIQLAHSLGLTVVAEGVESNQLLDALAALHCDYGQGLHIGGAMPLDELSGWLRDTADTARLDVGPEARILPLHPPRRPPATG